MSADPRGRPPFLRARHLGATAGLLLAFFASYPGSAGAQRATGESRLGQVEVTATRSPQSSVELVSDTDRAEFDDWRGQGIQSVNEGLGLMSGITLSANGGPASTGSLFIRGASGGQTLTLIDGFRLSSASLGQPTYEALPLMLAERVEVLRGPGSAYYGADALGGAEAELGSDEGAGDQGQDDGPDEAGVRS